MNRFINTLTAALLIFAGTVPAQARVASMLDESRQPPGAVVGIDRGENSDPKSWVVDARDVKSAHKRINIPTSVNAVWTDWEKALVSAQELAAKVDPIADASASDRAKVIAFYQLGAMGAAEVGQLWTVWKVYDIFTDQFGLEATAAYDFLEKPLEVAWKGGKFVHKGFQMEGHKAHKNYWSPQAGFTAALEMGRIFAECGNAAELEKAMKFADDQLRLISGSKRLPRSVTTLIPGYHVSEFAWRAASARLWEFVDGELAQHDAIELKHEFKYAAPADDEMDWTGLTQGMSLLGKSGNQDQWSGLYRDHDVIDSLTFHEASQGSALYTWEPDSATLEKLGFKPDATFSVSNHCWMKVPAAPLAADFKADDAGLVLLGGIPLACSWSPGLRWDKGWRSRFQSLGGFMPLDTYAYDTGGWRADNRRFNFACNWLEDTQWGPSDPAKTALAKKAGIEYRRCAMLMTLHNVSLASARFGR